MRVEINWLDQIVDKLIQKHNVYPDEVEECFDDSEQKVRKAQEGKYYLHARSYAGRYLFVIFVKLDGQRVRVISARDMTVKERRVYSRK